MSANSNTGIPREEIQWFPTIDPKKCTNCGACIKFCPNGVYADGEAVMEVALPFKCVVGCSYCTSLCPPQAISFPADEALMENLRELREKYGRKKQGTQEA